MPSSTGAALAAGLAAAAVLVLLSPGPAAHRLLRLGRPRRSRWGAGVGPGVGLRVAVAVAAVVAGLAFGVVGPVLLAAAVAARQGWRERSRRRQEAQLRAGLVEFWSALAGEFAAGQPPANAWPAALAVAAPSVAVELAPVAAAAALGLPTAEPLRRLSAPGAESARWVAAIAAIGAERGGAQAAALQRIAAAARAESEQRARQQALLAGGRATTRVLMGLPLFGLLLGTAFGAEPVSFLLRTGGGRACLAAAVALLLVGRWWAARVVADPADADAGPGAGGAAQTVGRGRRG